MRTVHLINGDVKRIIFKEKLVCSDKDMILIRDFENREMSIPKANIAYIEE